MVSVEKIMTSSSSSSFAGSAAASLLPDDHAQFNTKDYWDKFFIQRGQSAFEWYGHFQEISPLLLPKLSKSDRILVIGCGNSNFSSDLYDKGFHHITNLDFSELVIDEMKQKNQSREHMTWVVGDMTRLDGFAEASFDVVLDKGALDALLSVNDTFPKQQAQQMFREIQRVLTINGRYLCITLAEDYIWASLYQFFCVEMNLPQQVARNEFYWNLGVQRLVTNTPSPFIPFFLQIVKSAHNPEFKARVYFDTMGRVNTAGSQLLNKELAPFFKHVQEFQQMSYRIGKLQMGRFETIPLWSGDNQEVPRFTLYILDANEGASLSCAVFLIPFGREADYQFTTHDGLLDIAFQAACKRLIVVACNRPHQFGEMAELQAELSPVVISFKLADMDPEEKIPYMAIAPDKSWEEIEQGKSKISGPYIIEEKEEDEEEDNGAIYRRLIFLQNQQFVQTEVRLVPPIARKAGGGKKKKGSKGKSSGGKAAEGEKPSLVFDYKYLDEHHKAMLASLCLNATFLQQASTRQSSTPATAKALLIGLGGGALTMAMQKCLPSLSLTACELDDEVHQVANKFFGFEATNNTSVVIQEGMSLVNDFFVQAYGEQGLMNKTSVNTQSLFDLLLVDVDSKDTSLGLSAPPRDFINFEALEKMHALLHPGGLIVFNVVARSKPMLQDFIGRLRTIFNAGTSSSAFAPVTSEQNKGRILQIIPSSDNVNICLVCVKAGGSSNISDPSNKKKVGSGKSSGPAAVKEVVQWRKHLESWLSVS